MKIAQIKHWDEDLKYYDPKNIEIKTLLKLTNFKNKKVLDIGCGIGRLTLPIAKVAKRVVGIDKDKSIIEYCKKIRKKRNIEYLHKNIVKFNQGGFDIVIFAQPVYTNFNKILESISNNLNRKGKLIIIKWIDRGNEYNKLLTPFWEKDKDLMENVWDFSKDFLTNVRKFFRIKKNKTIETYCSYPSKDLLIKSLEYDSPRKFTKRDIKLLGRMLKKVNYRKLRISMKMYLCEKR